MKCSCPWGDTRFCLSEAFVSIATSIPDAEEFESQRFCEPQRQLFTLLEEGQQYTFEEMYQLWHQKEVYVRLYTMLTPLPIDQRLLTLRQLIKRDLVSQYTGDAELEQLGKCLLEGRLANGIGVHLGISVG